LVVKFLYRRPETGRKVGKVLRINQTLTSDHSKKFVHKAVLVKYIDRMVLRKVFSPAYLDNTPGAPMKAQILRNLRSAPARQALAAEAVARESQELSEENGRRSESKGDPSAQVAPTTPPWGRLFAPTLVAGGETGKSLLLVGSSFSGKTHLYVDELNALDPEEYDLIVLMTESRFAEPLKRIRPELGVVVLEGFRPSVVNELKALNDGTGNRYRFLIILDDIVDQKHSSTLSKMLLTYRNANVTTALVIQYAALVNKCTRGSLHAVVITGFRSLEDWELAGRIFDLTEWAKDQMADKDIEVTRSKIKKCDAYRWLKEQTAAPGDVIYLDQKHSLDPVLWQLRAT
jgi:hypothetical protein